MSSFIVWLDTVQPTACGINLGPLSVFVAASMWACDGIFRPYVSVRLNAEALVAWEHIVSLLPLMPLINYYIIRHRKPMGVKIWVGLFVIGIAADAIANTLITMGYSLGHVALVALLQQCQPIFGLLGAYFVLKEDVRGRVAVPLVLFALIGLFLMMWPYARESAHEHGAWGGVKATGFGLAAAIIWASETVIGRYLLQYASPQVSSLELLTYRQFIGLIFMCIYVYVLSAHPLCDTLGLECMESPIPDMMQTAIISLMAVIELSSHFLYFMGLHCTPAGIAIMMELAHPLLMLTLIPTLTQVFDPEFTRTPLESEQKVGALILTMATCLLGIYAGKVEAPTSKVHGHTHGHATSGELDSGAIPPILAQSPSEVSEELISQLSADKKV
uniref:EamA domain-containing protein n=1 Tax=Eutreptiella gymnastica TaxID=73025 RepID=A0A7S1I548_9EUGL|mmetsp:Transcript_130285/g.225259  ORF Transcript_130285/g.225259 Transcript_130285/m.225259 type:complete len:388 (+) Transcript_130285:68-1231(+)